VRERPTNTSRQYEVPFQAWMDITGPDGQYGVSILNDSKCAADKPADNTLRLTLIHTPAQPYRWEASQHLMDQGLNRFSFGIYPHAGDYKNGAEPAAAAFNQPLQAFVTDAHPGALGSEYAFACLQGDVILRAAKKAENSDLIIVRFNESAGKQVSNARFSLGGGIASATETLADETCLHGARIENGALVFDMNPFEVKTFALTIDRQKPQTPKQEPIALPYNTIADMIPPELYPEKITCGGVQFITSKEAMNAMACRGQRIDLPAGAERAHLLLCSLAGDMQAQFKAGETPLEITVQDAFEAIGKWDLIGLGETGHIKRAPLAWNATHTHRGGKDVPARHFYLFKNTIELNGAQNLAMPANENILVFALTVGFDASVCIPGAPLYDELEARPFDYEISPEDLTKARPTRAERLLEHLVRREKIITASFPGLSGVISVADIYAVVRQMTQKKKAKK